MTIEEKHYETLVLLGYVLFLSPMIGFILVGFPKNALFTFVWLGVVTGWFSALWAARYIYHHEEKKKLRVRKNELFDEMHHIIKTHRKHRG